MNQQIRIPSKSTLKKYGLSEQDYLDIIKRQGNVCPVCGKFPKSGRFVIDHFHHKHYARLPAEIRKAFVRGCLDWHCNYFFLPVRMTWQIAKNLMNYLLDFEKRRPK